MKFAKLGLVRVGLWLILLCFPMKLFAYQSIPIQKEAIGYNLIKESSHFSFFVKEDTLKPTDMHPYCSSYLLKRKSAKAYILAKSVNDYEQYLDELRSLVADGMQVLQSKCSDFFNRKDITEKVKSNMQEPLMSLYINFYGADQPRFVIGKVKATLSEVPSSVELAYEYSFFDRSKKLMSNAIASCDLDTTVEPNSPPQVLAKNTGLILEGPFLYEIGTHYMGNAEQVWKITDICSNSPFYRSKDVVKNNILISMELKKVLESGKLVHKSKRLDPRSTESDFINKLSNTAIAEHKGQIKMKVLEPHGFFNSMTYKTVKGKLDIDARAQNELDAKRLAELEAKKAMNPPSKRAVLAAKAQKRIKKGISGWNLSKGKVLELYRGDLLTDGIYVSTRVYCSSVFDSVSAVGYHFTINHHSDKINPAWLHYKDSEATPLLLTVNGKRQRIAGFHDREGAKTFYVNTFHFAFIDQEQWSQFKPKGFVQKLVYGKAKSNLALGQGYVNDNFEGADDVAISGEYVLNGRRIDWASINLAETYNLMRQACYFE